MPISHDDAPVAPDGPLLPDAPQPWLPDAPAVAQQPPTPSLWDVQASQARLAKGAAPPKHRGRRALVSIVVLGALGAGGYLAYARSNGPHASEPTISEAESGLSTPVIVATTALAGTTALPDIVSVRPPYRVASFVETSRQVGVQGAVPFDQNIVVTGEVDYVTPIASLVFAVDGSVSTLDSHLILTNEHTYKAGDTADAPWERKPREPSAAAMDTLGYLRMYGDVVTPEVREAATNVVAMDEVVHGTPVTTYRFDVAWMTLIGTAIPTGAVLMKDELLEVHVTLSVDADGLLRVYDQQYDEQAWIDAAAAAPEDFDWFVHTRTEVVSTSNEPSTLVPPATFVDAPAG